MLHHVKLFFLLYMWRKMSNFCPKIFIFLRCHTSSVWNTCYIIIFHFLKFKIICYVTHLGTNTYKALPRIKWLIWGVNKSYISKELCKEAKIFYCTKYLVWYYCRGIEFRCNDIKRFSSLILIFLFSLNFWKERNKNTFFEEKENREFFEEREKHFVGKKGIKSKEWWRRSYFENFEMVRVHSSILVYHEERHKFAAR